MRVYIVEEREVLVFVFNERSHEFFDVLYAYSKVSGLRYAYSREWTGE